MAIEIEQINITVNGTTEITTIETNGGDNVYTGRSIQLSPADQDTIKAIIDTYLT